MRTETHEMTDPRERGPKPPFSEQRQPPPGSEEKMRNKPDHGEDSYRGSGRLKDCRALITGGDSGIGRAVAIAYAREGANVSLSYIGQEEERDASETRDLIEEAGQKALAGDLERLWVEHNQAGDGTTNIPAEYLEVRVTPK